MINFVIEILERRRASRVSRTEDSSLALSLDSSLNNLNDTENIRDLKDILGPLPDLPDSNINWSRRISSVSGIYEEIIDGDEPNCALKNMPRKMSRTSIASGIYEVMRPPLDIW